MARIKQKEAIILAIDIGQNSSQLDSDGKTYFEKAILCASMILKRKLFTESKDDLAIILFGSSKTNNPFSSQGNLFNNIEIVSSLGFVTWDVLKYIMNTSSTDINCSDWLSTLVIAVDMLKNENDDKIFTDLQIVMFSNFSTDISFDKVDSIIRCINHLKIKLTMIGKDFEVLSQNPMVEKFIVETLATVVDFQTVCHQLQYCKPKEVAPRPWKAALKFGNIFSIKVSGYKKVDEVPKGFKWHLCKSSDEPDSITELIKQTSFYYLENEVQKVVDRDNIIDGFRFGDTIIPVSDLDTDAFGYKSGPKSLQVLGFTKAKNIQRSFLMDGGAYIFKPDEDDCIAFDAIFKAMVEREEIMIVRKVYLMNSMPNIGAMFPQSEDDENYFVFVNLPYAEDEHLFKLPSLKSFKPNDKQKHAVYNLINAMNLDDENGTFVPENTYSPELQYVYYSIAQKAINQNKLLTKTIPEHIQRLLYPPTQIMEKAKQPINELKKLFALAKINKNAVKIGNNDEMEIKEPCVITKNSPVEDFNKLLERGMNLERVCHAMQKLTVELIESSSSLEELKKPASNLKALREFYIFNKNVNLYNDWMFHVKDSVLLSGKRAMWSQFIDSGIGLITSQEVNDSDISQEISEQFMQLEIQGDDDNLVEV